jgi:hypothetical protein
VRDAYGLRPLIVAARPAGAVSASWSKRGAYRAVLLPRRRARAAPWCSVTCRSSSTCRGGLLRRKVSCDAKYWSDCSSHVTHFAAQLAPSAVRLSLRRLPARQQPGLDARCTCPSAMVYRDHGEAVKAEHSAVRDVDENVLYYILCTR